MDLPEFLVKAKRSTYAGGGDDVGVDLPDGARELICTESPLTYRDRYYGWDPFSGEEVVQDGGRVVWSMNYYGRCVSNEVFPSMISGFLVKALGRVIVSQPYRGPEEYIEGEWRYNCHIAGDPQEFSGSEEILYRKKEVYRLMFHGGDVGWKP